MPALLILSVLSSLQSSSVTTDPVLTYITYVGLGLSVPSLLLLILVFLFLKNIMNMHRYILVNLAFTLGVATTLFVFGVDMTSSSLCGAIALGMHYFLVCGVKGDITHTCRPQRSVGCC